MKIAFRKRCKVVYFAWCGLIAYLIGGFFEPMFWLCSPLWLMTILTIEKRKK